MIHAFCFYLKDNMCPYNNKYKTFEISEINDGYYGSYYFDDKFENFSFFYNLFINK